MKTIYKKVVCANCKHAIALDCKDCDNNHCANTKDCDCQCWDYPVIIGGKKYELIEE